MNHFNEYYDLITTLHFGIVEYDGTKYCIIRDQLFDEPFTNANKLLKRNALRDLFDVNEKQALYKLTCLKAILDDLAEYKKGSKDYDDAFRHFLALSNHHNVLVKFGNSDGPINNIWSTGKKVGNLRKELDDEIWVRQRMVEDLTNSFEMQLNMNVPTSTNENDGRWKRVGITNIKSDDEIDWAVWSEINKADNYP